ncbi:MAG: hypothetical protein Q9228_007179 [Teloschistes exilis]
MDLRLHNERPVAQDSLTGEEISSTTIPPSTTNNDTRSPKLTELCSPSKKRTSAKESSTHSGPQTLPALTSFTGRAGLGAYIHAPESFPASRIISYDENFVVANDLFPKSSVHLLLLPRHPEKQLLHPYEALQDIEFLSTIQEEVRKLKLLVAKELQRRFSKFSSKDQEREEAIENALEAGKELDEATLPPGRDWSAEVVAGIHSHPSMSHLHIHILSVDHYNQCMRHRKHYNSFATPFLVGVDEFPMKKEDMKRRFKERFLQQDLVCWRCGRNFGNKFKGLKEHLEEEFEEWKKE